MRFLCKIDIHKWVYSNHTNVAQFDNSGQIGGTKTSLPKTRTCHYCGEVEEKNFLEDKWYRTKVGNK